MYWSSINVCQRNLCWQNFIEQYSPHILRALWSSSPLHRYRLFCSTCYTECYIKGILLPLNNKTRFIFHNYCIQKSIKRQVDTATAVPDRHNSCTCIECKRKHNVYISKISGASAMHPSCSQHFCFKVCLTSKLMSTRRAIYLAVSYVRTQGNRATPLPSPSVSHPSR